MHIEVLPTENHPTGAGRMATLLAPDTVFLSVSRRADSSLTRHTEFDYQQIS